MTLLLNLFSQPWVLRLGWVLLHFLWEGTLIALALAVLFRLLPKTSSSTRYALAGLALLLCAAAPVITWTTVVPPGGESLATEGLALTTLSPSFHDHSSAPIKRPNLDSAPLPPPQTPWLTRSTQEATAFLPYAVGLWLAGVVLLSTRLTLGWIWMRGLSRSSIPATEHRCREMFQNLLTRMQISRPVRLLESALVEVPTLIGWLRPRILIPVSLFVGLTPAQLEAIFAHELAHVRRHDYLLNLLQTLIETILFYHPAVWWISRQLRQERENCCDDLALEVTDDRLVYISALAQLEETRAMPLALSASGGPLLQRIQRLAGVHDREASFWPLWILLTGLLFVACLTKSEAKPDMSGTAAELILGLSRFVTGVDSLDYSETRGDPQGEHSFARWREMGNCTRIDWFSRSFSSNGKRVGNSNFILSYNGEHGYEFNIGGDRLRVQKEPFQDLTEGYSAGLEGPLLPFEFLDKKGTRSSSGRVTLQTLKSSEALAAVAKRAVLAPDKDRSWLDHPCVAVRISHGNDRNDSQAPVDFIAYFATDLDLYPIAWEIYKQGKLSRSYCVTKFKSVPLGQGSLRTFRYPEIAQGTTYESDSFHSSTSDPFTYEYKAAADLKINTLSRTDFTLKPPAGGYLEDLEANTITKIPADHSKSDPVSIKPTAAILDSGHSGIDGKPVLNLQITLVEIEEKAYAQNAQTMDDAVAKGDLPFFDKKKNVFVTPPASMTLLTNKNWFSMGGVDSFVGSVKYEKIRGVVTTALQIVAYFAGVNGDFIVSSSPENKISVESIWSDAEPALTIPQKFDPSAIPADLPKTLDFNPKMHIAKATDQGWHVAPGKTHGFWIGETLGQLTRTSQFKDRSETIIDQIVKSKIPSRLAVFLTAQPVSPDQQAVSASLK